ncbi:hypothetical protein HRbin41_00731 [bacterium HR41]|nr:hypothetical protein HRbin41_00731 [bacterium HR41]
MNGLMELREHLEAGGAATLNLPATYPVQPGAVVAPARYAARGAATFVFETRFVDGDFRRTVLIDSKQSQSNRAEEGLLLARRLGGPARLIPTIRVRYPHRELTDLELPHRAFDAHIRFATQNGQPVVRQEWYQRLRDSQHDDLSAVFTTSPTSLAFGAWDSSRQQRQLRLRGLYVSELFGVVDDRPDVDPISRRSGARLDPLGQNIYLTPEAARRLAQTQEGEMSPKTLKDFERKIENQEKAGKTSEGQEPTISATPLGLGGIPPGTETPFGVSVPEVRRVRTISLAGLRRLRFGGSHEDDVKARTALLAMILLGAAYADQNPEIRAYCDIGTPRARVLLDDEERANLDLSVEACPGFLERALRELPGRLAWRGHDQVVDGDPELARGAVEDSGKESSSAE